MQHSVLSFPVAEYGHSPAIFPTKLYESPTLNESEVFTNMLPGPASAVVSNFMFSLIATLRFGFNAWVLSGVYL